MNKKRSEYSDSEFASEIALDISQKSECHEFKKRCAEKSNKTKEDKSRN